MPLPHLFWLGVNATWHISINGKRCGKRAAHVGVSFIGYPGTLMTGGRVDYPSWRLCEDEGDSRDALAETDVMAVMAVGFVIRQLSFLGK